MKNLEMMSEDSGFTTFQKEYNKKSKKIVHVLGTNIALFICVLLPFLLVGFIWTDFGLPTISIQLVSEGIITIAMLFIGEVMMMMVGSDGGKLDNDYLTERKIFDDILTSVNKVGTMLVPVFCDWQVDVEMEHATTSRLRRLRMTKSDWESLKDKDLNELSKIYGKKKAKEIIKLNTIEPIELNESVLMYDNCDISRGGVPISGYEFLRKKTLSAEMFISSIFCGLITISVAITLTTDISIARVLYTVFKVITLLFRMAVGYNLGTKAYNTVEVRRLQAKNNYLRKYVRFVEDKTYLKLGDKYGDLECYKQDEDIVPEEPLATN